MDGSRGFGLPLSANELLAKETFSTRLSRRGDVAWLALGGELDAFTAPRLREAIDEAMPAGATEMLVLDMRGLSFLDSSGLAVVLGAHERVSEAEAGKLRILVRGSPAVEALFETIGAAEYLPLVDDAGELTGVGG